MSRASAGSRRALATCPLPPGRTGNAAPGDAGGSSRGAGQERERRTGGGTATGEEEGAGCASHLEGKAGKEGRGSPRLGRVGIGGTWLAVPRELPAPAVPVSCRVPSFPLLSLPAPRPFPSLPVPVRNGGGRAGLGGRWPGSRAPMHGRDRCARRSTAPCGSTGTSLPLPSA